MRKGMDLIKEDCLEKLYLNSFLLELAAADAVAADVAVDVWREVSW